MSDYEAVLAEMDQWARSRKTSVSALAVEQWARRLRAAGIPFPEQPDGGHTWPELVAELREHIAALREDIESGISCCPDGHARIGGEVVRLEWVDPHPDGTLTWTEDPAHRADPDRVYEAVPVVDTEADRQICTCEKVLGAYGRQPGCPTHDQVDTEADQ